MRISDEIATSLIQGALESGDGMGQMKLCQFD